MLEDKNSIVFLSALHHWKLIANVSIFLNEVKSLLSSLGKMIGEQLWVYHRLKRLAIKETCGRIVLDNLIWK